MIDGGNTKSISREHTVLASRSGLVTVTGGKWTTYRAMAEDVLQKCFDTGVLPPKAAGITNQLPLVGSPVGAVRAQHQRRPWHPSLWRRSRRSGGLAR